MVNWKEGSDYTAYRYDSVPKSGEHLTIERKVVCKNADISALVEMGADRLDEMLEESTAQERAAYAAVDAAATEWEQKAANTQMIKRAQQYLLLSAREVAHTNNRWQPCPYNDAIMEISNRVYRMRCWITVHSNYDVASKKVTPGLWNVYWNVRLNTTSFHEGVDVQIDGQDCKHFRSEEAAQKYLEGRKKKYASLFTEISPEIPKQYAYAFKINGVLLPGYRVEGEE